MVQVVFILCPWQYELIHTFLGLKKNSLFSSVQRTDIIHVACWLVIIPLLYGNNVGQIRCLTSYQRRAGVGEAIVFPHIWALGHLCAEQYTLTSLNTTHACVCKHGCILMLV